MCDSNLRAAIATVALWAARQTKRGTVEVLDAVDPINRLLCELHGPAESIGHTMSRLLPFPCEISSLPDAELLDLNILVNAGAYRNRAASAVEARARYATGARVEQVRAFYVDQLERAGATICRPEVVGNGTNALLRAVLADGSRTDYVVSIDECRGYRAVKVTVSYEGFDARDAFETFAGWHNGVAPVDELTEPTGFEISTFSHGREPGALVLYSTYYECPRTSRMARRAAVDQRVSELGWTYREPREGIMFMQAGQFDAETHVMGDDTSSNVTFVGEFALRASTRGLLI